MNKQDILICRIKEQMSCREFYKKNYIFVKVVRVNTVESWNLMKRFGAVRICHENGITNSNILWKITWLSFVKYL